MPDRESGGFATAIVVIRLREDGLSWRGIEDETDVSRSTARGIVDGKERYLKEAEAAVQ